MAGLRQAGARYTGPGGLEDVPCPACHPENLMTRSRTRGPAALDAAQDAFEMLTAGPAPLAVHAARLAPGLPDRMVALDELRAILLHPATSTRQRNLVWAELVRRARTGGPEWMVGLAGVAMPGLRRAEASLALAWRCGREDLQAEILTGFLAAVAALDLDRLEVVPLASRLCWAAFRAGHAHARAEAGHAARRRDLSCQPSGEQEPGDRPALPWGHPDLVLAAAVRAGVLTPAQADLIGRSRLEGVRMAVIAAERSVSHPSLCNQRRRAETRLAAAIRNGLFDS
jgi:hypothetical protein